jgi:hypothetical protein
VKKKPLLAAIAALVLMPLLALGVIWWRPELVLRPATVRWALQKFLPEYHISFRSFELKTRSLSLLAKDIELHLEDACVAHESATLKIAGCLDRLHVDTSLEYGRAGLRWLALRRAEVIAERPLEIRQSGDTHETETSESTPLVQIYQNYHRILSQTLALPKPAVELRVPQVLYANGDSHIEGGITTTPAASDMVQIGVDLRGVPQSRSKIRLDLTWGTGTRLKIAGRGEHVGVAHAELKATHAREDPGRFAFALSARDPSFTFLKSRELHATLVAEARHVRLESQASLQFSPIGGTIHIRNRGCQVAANLSESNEVALELRCPLQLRYPFARGMLEFDINNVLKLRAPADNLEQGHVDYLTEHAAKYTRLRLATGGNYDLSHLRENKIKGLFDQLIPPLNAELEIQNIRDWLSTVPAEYTVLPAPLNSMNGDLRVVIAPSEGLRKVSNLSVKLKDKTQRLDFELITGADFRGKDFNPAIDVDFKLRNLALRLPQWNLRDPKPALFADSRFQRAERDAPRPVKESAPLKIKTEVLNPVQITTNLIKPPLRILFDLDWQDGALAGLDVKLLPLKAEFLRRKFEVRSLHFRTDGGHSSSLINSEVRFFLPDYVVTANVEGTTEQPVLSLSSNPPLAENDIYSVLVFGKPMSALQNEEQSSLAAARQMFATGLFSLTSLYFLGSTPIESIYFDPETGEATARVRLDSKSSVSVGADARDVNRVEVRRSLGAGWYIQGGVKGLDQTQESYGGSVEKVISY